jgi:hypothetical protein
MSVNPLEELNQPEAWSKPDESLAELEQQLTLALQPVAPPDGFADRVVERLQSSVPARAKIIQMPLRSRMWSTGAIAAALLLGVFVAQQTHVRHQRERAERAQQQFEAAMRITDQTLEHVRQQLQQAGVSIGD